jgi:hypothetical protein
MASSLSRGASSEPFDRHRPNAHATEDLDFSVAEHGIPLGQKKSTIFDTASRHTSSWQLSDRVHTDEKLQVWPIFSQV